MRLQNLQHSNFTVLSAVLIAAFTLSSTVAAAGVRYHPHDNPAHHYSTDGSVFPFLRRVRDSVIEWAFGLPDGGLGNRAKYALPAAALPARYRNDIVVRFNVTSSDEEAALSKAASQLLLDVWAFAPDFVDIRMDERDVSRVRKMLPSSLIPTVLIPDVAAAVWDTFPSKNPYRRARQHVLPADQPAAISNADFVDVFFQNYQPLPVIENWMRLQKSFYPSIANLTTIGKSAEGRDIIGLRVGNRISNTPSIMPRKTILVTGGLHGREWISTSTVSYLLWSVVTTHDKEPMLTKLLEHFDIVFVPVLNPDGYDYTWLKDRLWRKSRQRTKTSFCPGLDLDHAFGYEWESTSHQTDPCSESYGGEQPFQAVEASELADWAKRETEENNVRFVGFLDLHSYSQQVLFPYSYTCEVDPPNRENLEELAVGLAKAIRLSSGESYSVASACEGAFATDYSRASSGSLPRVEAGGGSAIDWFYHELHAKFSYQVKLRDTGSYGFLLPKENIVPTGEEMLNALKYFGDFLLGNNGIEKVLEETLENPSEEQHRADLRKRARTEVMAGFANLEE